MIENAVSEVRELYHGRAKEDYSQSAELLRLGLQFEFAANGGASLAILSFLTAIAAVKDLKPPIKVSTVPPRFTLAVGIYLAGVLFAALALWKFSLSRQSWGHFWENNAFTGKVDFQHWYAVEASRHSTWGRNWFFLSAVAFALASSVAVTAFLP